MPYGACFEWPFDLNTALYSGIYHGKDELLKQLTDLAANFQFNAYRATDI